MNFAIVFTVFPIVFVGELPDKTMFASLLLATRGRPLSVWIGAAAAFTVHVVIAITIGVVIFHVLPHRVIDAVVAGIFFVGALLAIKDARSQREHDEKVAELAEHDSAGRGKTVVTAFGVIFLAEWGDLTQILTANFAAHYHAPLSVGVGALAALWAVATIAVVTGKGLPARVLSAERLRLVTAVALFALAGFEAWSAAR